MHSGSDYGRMIWGCFANASAASPPAVYFAKQPPIIRLLPTRTNVMGLCLRKRHWGHIPVNELACHFRMHFVTTVPCLAPVTEGYGANDIRQ